MCICYASSVYRSYIGSYRWYIHAMSILRRRLEAVYRFHNDPVSILYWCHISLCRIQIERIWIVYRSIRVVYRCNVTSYAPSMNRISIPYRSCIDFTLMSYRCIQVSHRAYSNNIWDHINCISMPCRFIYVVYNSFIDDISILYRFYIDVISMYMDFTSSVFKAYIDSYRLSTNAMSIHIRRL